ncbi:hypothetical protein HRG_012040 [Hirsutella rhossiliensis]
MHAHPNAGRSAGGQRGVSVSISAIPRAGSRPSGPTRALDLRPPVFGSSGYQPTCAEPSRSRRGGEVVGAQGQNKARRPSVVLPISHRLLLVLLLRRRSLPSACVRVFYRAARVRGWAGVCVCVHQVAVRLQQSPVDPWDALRNGLMLMLPLLSPADDGRGSFCQAQSRAGACGSW